MSVGKRWKVEDEGDIMLLTLTLTVLIGSIFVLFSQEFIGLFKKIMSIPGVKLFLPLAVASSVVEIYEELGWWLLSQFQLVVHQSIYYLAAFLPFDTGAISLICILYLFLVASIPSWIYRFRTQKRVRSDQLVFTRWLGLWLWIMAAILLLVGRDY
jgi:hypothetical protein